jgi:hypothetical protein
VPRSMMKPMPAQLPFRWNDPGTWPWIVYLWIGLFVLSWIKPLWRKLQSNRVLNWPVCPARVDSVYVIDKKRSFWTTQQGPAYVGGFFYSYSAEGRKATGSYEQEFASKAEAANYVRELEGKPVTVSYHPEKPSISAITPQSLAALLSLRPPGDFQPVAENVPSWVKPLLWPFIALAAIGFVLSLWIHLAAVAGHKVAPESWLFMLSTGFFVVFFPAVAVARRRAGATQRKGYWKVVLKGSPEWMRYVMYIALGYAVVNSVVLMPQAPKGKSVEGTPVIIWRAFSSDWIAFYSAALAILYAAARGSDKQARPPRALQS